MDYLVVKFLDTGAVEFRIHAVSHVSHIPNPFVRAGFRIFGRHLQRRFARTATARMKLLVEAELRPG